MCEYLMVRKVQQEIELNKVKFELVEFLSNTFK